MSLSDYSQMEQEIQDAPDMKILSSGQEVQARIMGVNCGISDKNGARWIMPRFDVPSDPLIQEFNDFMWDPADHDKLEPKQAARNLSQFKNFINAFDIDISRPVDWDGGVDNKEGFVIVGVRKSDEYGDQNTVKRYIIKR